MASEPSKGLSREHVMDALASYESRSSRIHAQVKEIALNPKLKEKITSVIRDALLLDGGTCEAPLAMGISS